MKSHASWALVVAALAMGCGDDASIGAEDSGRADVGTTDTGAVDSGNTDAGANDTGLTDTGVTDTGLTDTGTTDAGVADVAVMDAGDDDAGAMCLGRPAGCVSGTPGGTCGDALLSPDCVAGSWVCPSGTIPVTQCACVGRPPGMCTCGPSGWECDAGARLNCDPSTVTCRALPPMCPSGQVPSIDGPCWGPCVPFSDCAPIPCEPGGSSTQCPQDTVCHGTTRTCGPFL